MGINWRTVQRVYETLLAPFLRLGEWLDDRRCAQEGQHARLNDSEWLRGAETIERFTASPSVLDLRDPYQAIDVASFGNTGKQDGGSGWEAYDDIGHANAVYAPLDGDKIRFNNNTLRWEKCIGWPRLNRDDQDTSSADRYIADGMPQ